jgi:hypothetical protein
MWGNTLTPTDVNATGFGVSLKLLRTSTQTTTTSMFRISLEVYYTEAGVTYKLKHYNGATWDQGELKRWNGSTWVTHPLKMWDGSTWVTL